MKVVFACLAIGDLGIAGKLSLDSILKIPNFKLFVLADPAGRQWIEHSIEDKTTFASQLTILQINEEELRILNDLDISSNYRPFGNPKFFRLMYLKWEALRLAISLFPEEPWVVFTDLDVYWKKSPILSMENFEESNFQFAVQQDSVNHGDRVYLCPGIMVWKTTDAARGALENIRQSHEMMLIENPTMPDDKALNVWSSMPENKDSYVLLSPYHFVIGHRLLHLLLSLRGFKHSNFIAYHANYTVGLTNKSKLLNAVRKSERGLVIRIFFASYLLLAKMSKKVIRRK